MYLRILKKDLRRKKTMNIILLIFVILSATFIASSANNMLTVSQAVDHFFEKANVPDYWFAVTGMGDLEAFENLAQRNGYSYEITRLIQVDPKNVTVEREKMEYGNSLGLSLLEGIRIFDKENRELTEVNDGEIYVSAAIFESEDNDFHEGSIIQVEAGGVKKEFILKGYVKDALFGSQMVGMTRFFISENDFAFFMGDNVNLCSLVNVYTKASDYERNFNELGLNVVMSVDYGMIKMLYIMDMLIAAVLMVVSVCLILISMVILRFIINFTINEEFREIGVMKAIGLPNGCIRGLYLSKYFAIAVLGTVLGLAFSFPFGRLMLGNVSKKIIVSGEDNFLVNLFAAALAAASVVLFSYMCTRRIRGFSPIDAIRNGETGERYYGKGFIHLNRSRIAVIPFMALNDIFSGMRKYVSMIIIFIIGTLLVILPVNTVNTLRSDGLIVLFNMAESDHVISQELLFTAGMDNTEKIYGELAKTEEFLRENGIEADIFQEIMFRCNIAKDGYRANSLAFQGIGGVTADRYVYMEGSAPQNKNEVALSYITADRIGAQIGDEVEIKTGEKTGVYLVTAINQSMNNMGEGIRFYQEEELDYAYAAGSFGIQINYRDNPDAKTLEQRKEMLQRQYPDAGIYDAGEYISHMMGDTAGQIEGIKKLILMIILCINILVAVLMVKSFITKEKSEIALLKAIGFRDGPLCAWQTLRIGIVLIASVIAGTLSSKPLSELIITPIFRMMGAFSIEYEIRPLEVYVMYPLIVLGATAFAAFLSAQGLRKISSREISNIE